jgi:TPR repeat protein
MKYVLAISFACLISPASTLAETDVEGGTLNPDEMSLSKAVERAQNGDVNMVICSQGYLMTKKGSHAEARTVFRECAKQGWTGTMTWMSYMDDNGFGGEYDPHAAADWDKKAAEAGDPIGRFNYGLNLLRGHGVTQDLQAGKRFVDQAAQDGLKIAQELQAAQYDPTAVTPDADEWKYKPRY